MRTVNIHVATTQLSRLVDEVAAGGEVVIARAGRPVAKLVPIEAAAAPRRLGRLKGRMRVPDDFDAPLPEAVLATFEPQVGR